MNIPCLKTKLLIPELPDKVLHSRRIKSLPISKERAVIITAPGGYGKTTAVLLSLKKKREHTHWYRLEKEDRFLPVFYAHLIETLFADINKDTLDCQRGLPSVSDIAEEYSLLNALICQDAWKYYADVESNHYLVLDDFQNVMDNPRISESVAYFITNMPPAISIVVMSRVDTGIFSGKLSLNKHFFLIGNDDLRFSREETEQLLKIYKIKPTPTEIDRIHTYTEGWIAGLVMISRIDHPLPFQPTASLELDDAKEQSLFHHFFNEFFQGIDPLRLQDLVEMSILDDFTCADVMEILHIEDAAELLKWLENSNLYIQKYMPHPTKYRFHSLFRRELMTHLKRTKSAAYIRELYARAAHHYNGKGELQTAIGFYIKAGQTEKAIHIMSAAGAELFASGKPEEIMYLTREFPEHVIQADPYLLFYRGLMMLTSDIDEAYNCLRTALLMFKDRKDMSYLMNAFGMILVMAFQTNDFKYVKDVVSYIPKLSVALGASTPRNKLLISGFINLVAEENFTIAMTLHRLIKILNVPEPIWDYSFLIIRGMLLYRTGKLKAAFESIPQILNHPVGLASDQWRMIGLVGCHNTLWLKRDIEASRKIMQEFAELGEKYDSDFCRSFAFRLSAITKYQTRDINGAMADMENVAECYVRYASPLLASAAMITKYLWETEMTPAKNLLAKAEAEFINIPEQDAGHGYYELCQGMMGAIYKVAGDYDKAESFLLSAYQASLKKKARQHACGVAMHLADLYDKMNSKKLFEKYLRFWAKQSSKNDYVFFHEMDYVTLVRACALAVGKKIFPEHMRKIIGLYFGLENAKDLAENPSTAYADPKGFLDSCIRPSKREQIIRITFFGSFSMQKDNLLIGEKEWKTRKVSGICKYILATPDKRVTRESLAAVFWPESDAKAAFTSLRVALYELRKSLARFGMGFEDEYALIVEDKSGFHLGRRNIVKTDAQEFGDLYDQYNSQALSEEQKEHLLVQMTRLYTGDFLVDSPDYEWNLTRERYKSIFIEASMALAQRYIKKGALKEAEELLEKHMALDPFDEKGCNHLVEVYKITGQKARAHSFVRQFKKRFQAEMGVKPDLDF